MTLWSGKITRAAAMRPCYELVFAKSHESEIGTFGHAGVRARWKTGSGVSGL